jgi:hypothetical protein
MNKKIIISAAAIIALAACSEDKGAVSTVGTVPSTEAPVSAEKSLSDADIAFMNGMLDSFGSNSQAVASDGANDVTPTDEPTLTLSPVLFTFTTEKEVVYNEIKSNGSCWVNLYDEEKGISFYKSKKEKIPGYSTILDQYDDATIFLKENEGALYMQDLHYKTFAGRTELCVSDSIAYVAECNEKGGLYRIYNDGCGSSLEMSCVAKVSSQTELRAIANTFKGECETFIANLPEAEELPTVHCQGDTENGMVCDTTQENGENVSANNVAKTLSDADIAFMNSMLDSFGSSNKAVVSDDVILDEVVPTDEPTLTLSPVLFTFTTEKDVVYNKIKSNGSCWVNLYNEENGISFYKSKREKAPGYSTILDQYDDATILLKENEGSLYMQDLHYKSFAGKTELCVSDSIAFVTECNEKGGIYKIYSGGCGTSLEMSCVAKVSSHTELGPIANTLKSECETFIANLPEADVLPTVHCQGDTENGMVCDTTQNE